MVTKIVTRVRAVDTASGEDHFQTEYFCLSTDTKPTGKNGDTLFEIDTQKAYVCNGTDHTWVEI